MKLSPAEINALNYELGMTFDTTLTEQRYNELMDALLPTLEGSPDAQGTLEGFGQLEWRKRRIERNHKTTAA
jgi:nucleoid DNA-binding protein